MPRDRNKDANDRRERMRFPIQRELRYKLVEDSNVVATGVGFTLDIGSGGASFFAGGKLKPGAFVELSISWPVLLDDRCAMRLIVFGRVLRTSDGDSACTIDKYEFRTSRTFQANVTPVRNDSMLQRWADTVARDNLKLHAAS